MNKNLWQTLGTFHFIHSPYKWIPAILLSGEHSTTMQIWTVSRLWFCRRSRTLKINIRRVLCIFESHTFLPKSWMCKKQTSVSQFYRSWNRFSRCCRFTHGRYSRSHSLGFGDWSISFRTEPDRWSQERELRWNPSAIAKSNIHYPIPIKHTNVIPTNIDHIPSNTKNSDSSAMLYIIEDNEAVIKMIIKGRSPTMRHVSRTRRVALDWLLDRINLDPKIQIRYIDTKHQLADMLTKGNFTRDEWNNLLPLFNISHFSSALAAPRISAW